MAFPEGLTLITVSDQLAGLPDGVLGTVTFRWPWLQGPTDEAFLAAGSMVVTTEADGTFTADVPATDDPGWDPSGWTLQVTITRGAAVTRGTAALPYDGGPVSLAAVFNPDDAAEPGVTYALLSSVTALDNRVTDLEEAPGGTAPSWASITGKPAAFPPEAHDQAISTVTGLQTALDGKATTGAVAAVVADVADLDDRVTALEGAGGGSTLVVRRAVVSSGNITPQNTSAAWQPLTGGPTLVIPAAVGDYIAVEVMGLLMTKDSFTFYDLAVLNGASLVRFGSSGTGTPTTEGDGSLYHDTAYPRTGTVFDFVVEAGDINGGNVTACIAVLSAGSGTFHAGFYPFRWRVLNHGPAALS